MRSTAAEAGHRPYMLDTVVVSVEVKLRLTLKRQYAYRVYRTDVVVSLLLVGKY